MQTAKKGILLVNLGSPRSTSVKDVKTYLDEFLMDKRVIDLPWILRAILVKVIILNFRPAKSAKAYQSVWTDEGSPLIVYTQRLQQKLQSIMDIPVEIGMRYAEPSIENGIKKLKEQGVANIVLVPLYPQYAMSTAETVIEKAEEVRKAKFPDVKIVYVDPFYNRSSYLDCLSATIKDGLPESFDVLQFSFHGLPERHLYKTDPSNTCKIDDVNCINSRVEEHNAFCYRHQCYKTVEEVIKRLNIPKDKIIVSFQSRLGKDKWLDPYTDKTLQSLPKNGIKNLAICCPAFVADCLETLEEISEEGREFFMEAGGEQFNYIPCMNDDDRWVNVVKQLCEEKLDDFYLIG